MMNSLVDVIIFGENQKENSSVLNEVISKIS